MWPSLNEERVCYCLLSRLLFWLVLLCKTISTRVRIKYHTESYLFSCPCMSNKQQLSKLLCITSEKVDVWYMPPQPFFKWGRRKKRSNGRLSDSTALNFMMRIARAPTVPIATSPSSTRSRSELNYIIKQEGHCTCCSPPSTSRPAMTRGATTTSRPIPSRSQPGSHPASRNRTLTSTSHI